MIPRRINKELEIQRKTDSLDCYSNYDPRTNSVNAIIYPDKIEWPLKTSTITLQYQFSSEYPFSPPKCFLLYKHGEKENIFKYYRNGGIFDKEYKELKGRECLCCSSLLCKGNWGPTLNMTDITKEIVKIINFKIRIYKRYLCKKIQEKYLVNLPIHNYI